jgi:hypothetical protein
MDKFERFASMFLFIKGFRSKSIHTELENTLDAVDSLRQAKDWAGCFDISDFSSQGHSFLARPNPNLAEPLRNLRKDFPLHPAGF